MKKKLSDDSYGKTVKMLREKAELKSEEARKKLFELQNVVTSFMKGDKEPINFDTLDSLFKLNEWQDLSEKVTVKKVFSSPDVIKFETIIEKGGLFGWHCHGDCIEVCEVIEGKLFDSVNNKTYLSGESAVYTPMQYHTPGALVYTKLLVTFNRI